MLGSLVMEDWEGTHDFPLPSFISMPPVPQGLRLNWVLTEGAWSPAPHWGHPHPRHYPEPSFSRSLMGRALLCNSVACSPVFFSFKLN